jgi:hypothetical protein
MANEETTGKFTDVSQEMDESNSENDSSLTALVNQEQESAYQRLRAELGREPTREEADEWLSAHTESY